MCPDRYISQFTNDLFISYAHIDDQPRGGADAGWVTELINELKLSLKEYSGMRGLVAMWNDDLIDDTKTVSDQLIQAVRESAILVSILSPSYITSKWCEKEVQEYFDESCVRGRSSEPFVIIEMRPVDRNKLPKALRDRKSRTFFEYDKEAGAYLPIGFPILKDRSGENYTRFLKRVAGLASHLFNKMEELKQLDSQKISRCESLINNIFIEEGGSFDTAKSEQVFINVEPLNMSMAKKIKVLFEGIGQSAFLPSKVETKKASQMLRENYLQCKAIVMVSPDFNENWIRPQLGQLNKIAPLRQNDIDFLLIVYQMPADTGWLSEYLKSFELSTKQKIITFHDLKEYLVQGA